MKRITKKESQAFNNKVIELLNRHGAVTSDYLSYEYKIETELGNFHVRLEDNAGSKVYTIFGCFEDVDVARNFLAITQGNIYTGKMNYHTYDAESCIRGLETMLNRFSIASLEEVV